MQVGGIKTIGLLLKFVPFAAIPACGPDREGACLVSGHLSLCFQLIPHSSKRQCFGYLCSLEAGTGKWDLPAQDSLHAPGDDGYQVMREEGNVHIFMKNHCEVRHHWRFMAVTPILPGVPLTLR